MAQVIGIQTHGTSDRNPNTFSMVGRIMQGIGSNSTLTRAGIKNCSMCVKDVEESYLDCVYICL